MNLGAFSGSSAQTPSSTKSARANRDERTLNQVLNRDVIELFDFLYNQLCLVYLYHQSCAPGVAAGESELSEGIFDWLWDIDRLGLY